MERACCYTCNKFVDITYMHRDVPFSDDSGVVKDVLVGVCTICDNVCALPATSTPKVQAALKSK